MSLVGEKVLLRVYLQSADRPPHTPTYERVIKAARREGLAGATVLRGILGTGYHGLIRAGTAWPALVEHAPIIVEIVDDAHKIAGFVRGPLDEIMIGGMLTLERAAVMLYRAGRRPSRLAGDVPAGPEQSASFGAAVSSPRWSTSSQQQTRPPPQESALRVARGLDPLSTVPEFQPGPQMQRNDSGILLRAFIGESDRFERKPLYGAIVQKVRELGLAGATVLRGAEGFGANSVVHKSSLLEMSSDLPVVIEIVDTEPKIAELLPHLETMVQEGMITMEHVVIVMYRHGSDP